MKKLIFSAGKPEIIEATIPHLLPETVLVKNHYSFVSSGTELSTLQKNKLSVLSSLINNFSNSWNKIYDILKTKGLVSTYFQLKAHFLKKLDVGYSTSGEVVSSNSKLFRVGDFVASAGFGFASHSEYSMIPINLLAKVQNKDDLLESSAATLGAIALQAIRRANLQIGETVCVVGLGLLGQLIVQLANLSGLIVFGVDLKEDRLEIAFSCGAQNVFLADQNWQKAIHLASNRLGVDAVILALSSTDESIINKSVAVCRPKGKIILVGDVPILFAREEFYKKELDFLISCSLGPGRYDHEYEQRGLSYPYHLIRWTEGRNLQFITDLINKKKLKIKPLIAKQLTLNEAELAYESLKKGDLGIVFNFTNTSETKNEMESQRKNFTDSQNNILVHKAAELTTNKSTEASNKNRVRKNAINCALIGAGGFAKTILMPILKRLEHVKLQSVFDPVFLAAQNFKEVFNFTKIAQSFEEVINSEEIDLIILTTPDFFHCSQTIKALSSGKAVFCEKPIVTNWQEYEGLKKFLNINKDSFMFFTADFNRSWAPLILETKLHLKSRISPLCINYRVSSGFVKKENFLENSFGRLIGEICHFFELFLFLTDSNPIKMTATFSTSSKTFFEENLSITLLFGDGSITNLFYSSLAAEDLEKERIELFWDQKTVLIDDYKNLTSLGFPKNFNSQSLNSDKGHGMILSMFLNSIIKDDNLCFQNSWERYLKASALSLQLENLLLKNGGIFNISEEINEASI